ncbi:unnamed protein product [Wuchereria bancrofti]|uniref:Uncharacterized protein n=1 Tax=Wuchereria bancrofti TaxID=6293 RepID=A0A3P7FGT2_WUCBA|nr:unnamed protein product [Wuchereria bancrofti]
MTSIFHLPVSDIVDKDETKQRTSRYVRPETVGNFMGISIYVNIGQDAVINMWGNDGKLEESISNAVGS